MQTLTELTALIHQWGVDRRIIGNGTVYGQWLKLMEEFGELCRSIAKGQSPIDDIGDIYVVLVMIAGIDGVDMPGAPESRVKMPTPYLMRWIGVLLSVQEFTTLPSLLRYLAERHDLTLEQCVQHAYDEIKDRRGYLNEQGVFVKEEA